MPLRHVGDLRAAAWFTDDPAAPVLRASLGPSGFAAHARVLHDAHGDERREGHLDDALLTALCDVLARHTTTPDHCWFGLWDGYGDLHGGDAASFLTAFSGSPRWPGRVFGRDRPAPPPPPAFPPDVLDGPAVEVDGMRHLLFEGPLSQAGRWGAAGYGHGVPRDINSPNLMWPDDHAWFVTTHVDSTWTGVGGPTDLVDELVADPRLEAVRTRYDEAALR